MASSEKITGAMKMISSAKMHKAEGDLRRLVPFRSLICGILGNLLSADAEFDSPLMEIREVNRVSIVVLGSDDGLCGAYNINIYKLLITTLADCRKTYGDHVEIELIPVGKKMRKAVRLLSDDRVKVVHPDGVDSKTTGEGVRVFTDKLRRRYEHGETDRVILVHMNFVSMSRQMPVSETFLPVEQSTLSTNGVSESNRPYIFEPGPDRIFKSVLPMFMMALMQEVFTQNRAAEQAARVMAMQSANDNAKKLLDELQLEYNKLRQQSITTELLDILGGQVR